MQARSAGNVKVIDVSHHQGAIDWAKVKADGVVGAMVKATEGGGSYVDPTFAANAAGAVKAGLPVGYYHYARPELNSAAQEAAHFADKVKGMKADFPHALDVEGKASRLGGAALTAWCVAWLKAVEQLTSHPVMIYTGASFAKSYLGKSLEQWPLWVAHYEVDQPMDNNTWSAWAIFQYSSEEKVDGIKGNVDMNAMEKAFYDKYVHPVVVPAIPKPTGIDTIKVVVNDKLAAYGRMIDGHVYLPLRLLGDALGVDVEWRAAEASPYVGGKIVPYYKLIDGKTYIGVRVAAEMLGGKASWDNGTKKVYLYK
ncbi:glycoside hydrolase [Paenibacillus rhizovicinus]|uniref:Glycoside hydrolase n=1 Tax=Paenibacillus rhizovicinus TaxID=2704463 RepID=A0A6C0NVU8_9BACL|nr:GH25 family lysozyme [Paenibacillus rhizovicinus]QHW30325.1 glycoside hydrolase [Paenibacillus rhizovicinus]